MTFWTIARRCFAMIALAFPVFANAFPTGSIEWVVPYAAGGGSDVVARVIASDMAKTLGQPIIINNKPGAGTGQAAQMLTDDPATIATLKRLLSDSARNYLGFLAADIQRRIDAAVDAAQLLSVLGQCHMALRQSKHGGAYVEQYLAPNEASFYGATVPTWPAPAA